MIFPASDESRGGENRAGWSEVSRWRSSGAGWSGRRRPTSWARGACGRCWSTGPTRARATDAGAGILSPETTKRDDPDLGRARPRPRAALRPARPEARRATRAGTAAGSCSWRRATPTSPRGSGSRNGRRARPRSARDDARAMVPGPRRRRARAASSGRGTRRRPPDVRRAPAAPRSRSSVSTCATNRSTTSARFRPTRSSIAGGAWTGKVAHASSGCELPVGPLRGQIIHLGVDAHDTGAWPIVQPVYRLLHGAVGRRRASRSGRRSRTPASRPTSPRAECTTCCARRCG